jgi:exodeoxyribonuclease VII large subunit
MGRVEEILAPSCEKRFWLRAELAQVKERNGIVYCDLVETQDGRTLAKASLVLYPAELQRVQSRFEAAGIPLELKPGTVIGVQCCLQFHRVYGLSLRGLDMDPAFVLGELELRRRRILAGLERDGLLKRNAQLRVPLLPNRILLITSRAGAAYHDFVRALDHRCGVRILLADAIMQGPQCESSILRALDLAARLRVDLVVIIRGGGSKLDLGSLDSEAIARRIAALSLPVWTAIGHETDISVLDAVAAESFRTPTAVAEALAARFERVARVLRDADTRLRSTFATAHRAQLQRAERSAVGLRNGTRKILALRSSELTSESHRLKLRVAEHVSRARSTCATAEHQLLRGYQVRLERVRQRVADAQVALRRGSGQLVGAEYMAIAALRLRLSVERIESIVTRQNTRLDDWERALQMRSAATLGANRARVDAMLPRLQSAVAQRIGPETATFRVLKAQLMASSRRALASGQEALSFARAQLSPQRVQPRVERERVTLAASERILSAHDPQRVLERGFSLSYSASGNLIRSIRDVSVGKVAKTRVADGVFEATIRSTNERRDDERET